MKCSKHPRYQVKRRPRCACEACWYLWARERWFAGVARFVTDRVKGLKDAR
jgi:hypothetical protein